LFRVLPFWPRERFLELAPRYRRIAALASIAPNSIARSAG
jgi:hypothetical protein